MDDRTHPHTSALSITGVSVSFAHGHLDTPQKIISCPGIFLVTTLTTVTPWNVIDLLSTFNANKAMWSVYEGKERSEKLDLESELKNQCAVEALQGRKDRGVLAAVTIFQKCS